MTAKWSFGLLALFTIAATAHAEVYPEKLRPLTSTLEMLKVLPGSYSVQTWTTAAREKNAMFKEWLALKTASFDPELKQYIYEECIQLNAQVSRQEEVGTLRDNEEGAFDTAENLTFGRIASPQERLQIRSGINALRNYGIQLGFNGYDKDPCGDYVISPLFIDAKEGIIYEFLYRGQCQ